MRFKVFLFSLIITFLGFLGFYTNSYCEALPDFILDPNSFEVLNGGAYSSTYQYGMTNDIAQMGFVYGVDAALNQINTDLYNKFGWDLQDAAWAIEDEVVESSSTMVQRNTIASLMSAGQLVDWAAKGAAGLKFFGTAASMAVDNLWYTGKQYIMGAVDSVTGKITDVYDNVVTYINNTFSSNISDTAEDLIDNNTIVNLSDNRIILTDHIIINSTYDFRMYDLKFTQKCLFYDFAGSHNVVGIFFPASYDVSTLLSSDSFGIGAQSGNVFPFTLYTGNGFSTVTINNVIYKYGYLFVQYSGGYNTVYCDNHRLNVSYSDCVDFVTNNSDVFSSFSYFYEYDPNIVSDYNSILDQLNGHYILSSDLEDINTYIGDFPVISVEPDGGGDAVPLISPSEDDLSGLQELIEDILARNAVFDDVLPEQQPEPEPEPEPDLVVDFTGTIVPDNFPTGITEPILDLFDFNFNIFSFFEPLFYLFGTFNGIFALWSFIPLVIIILVVIWALK